LEKITIIVASAHEDERNAMVALLGEQDDFRIVSVVEDNFGVVNAAIKLQPNVIVMDFCMGDPGSLRLAPVIKRNSLGTALVMLCSADRHIPVDWALRAGISGYLLKQHDFACLVSSVRCVFSGGLYVSEVVRKQAFSYFSARAFTLGTGRPMPNADFGRGVFTQTELQIFHGIILGRSDSEIASNLNMSIGAVRNSICWAKKKIGLHNRTQVIIYILSVGLIAWDRCFPGAPEDGF